MTEHRRVRQLESQSKLPGILWMVLIAGGAITMLSATLFGTENFLLHCVQVVSLALLLSLTLVAIADIDRPFQGTVHVNPLGFERARGLEFIRRARAIDNKDLELIYAQAMVELFANRRTDAFRTFREAVEKGYPIKQMGDDPELAALHNSPEFEQLGKSTITSPSR